MGENGSSSLSSDIQNIFQGEDDNKVKARLRERVLRFWLAIVGHPVVLKMQEKYDS